MILNLIVNSIEANRSSKSMRFTHEFMKVNNSANAQNAVENPPITRRVVKINQPQSTGKNLAIPNSNTEMRGTIN